MTNQEKIKGILRLILMLSGQKKYSLQEIRDRVQVSERTVFRYFEVIEDSGFLLERNNGYRLQKEAQTVKELNALFHFTEAEIFAIHHILDTSSTKTTISEKLIKKLHTLYDFKVLDRLNKKSELVHIDKLKKAIQTKKQVVLGEYRSSNSKLIRDRKVEPFAFLPDYRGVWCFDTEDGTSKQFYLSRIKEVQPTDSNWLFSEQHRIPFTDAFRMGAAEVKTTIHLRMDLKAYNLLKDEYPAAIQFVARNGENYDAEIPVAAFEGVGRFVMGLPGEVHVLGPQEFKTYLNEKVKLSKYDTKE